MCLITPDKTESQIAMNQLVFPIGSRIYIPAAMSQLDAPRFAISHRSVSLYWLYFQLIGILSFILFYLDPWLNMSSPAADERQALLPKTNDNDRGVVQEYGPAASSGTSTPSLTKPSVINSLSRKDLIWVLGGLWSTVFLGALDTTIVATLLSPIGSHFQKSHQASYLGTSYLLSVCCFTPLYGRLSDILGRKGAILLALFLFGMSNTYVWIYVKF